MALEDIERVCGNCKNALSTLFEGLIKCKLDNSSVNREITALACAGWEKKDEKQCRN